MGSSERFSLLRAELRDSLVQGEAKVAALMRGRGVSVSPGDVLIQEGTEHPFVYRLIEGWACRTRNLGDGRQQCILIFLPGDLFAVKSMFVNRHPDAVCVLSRANVERISHRELHDAYLRDGDIANLCTWQVMEEERRLHNWVVSLGQGSAEERVALLLIDFHGRLATAGRISARTLTFDMPLTQSQLADHLGITAIHTNRVLKSFRERGIVTVRDGQVSIMNMAALTQTAHPLLDAFERESPEYVGCPPETQRS
jgi:CRP/FNR family transcriptional regulator